MAQDILVATESRMHRSTESLAKDLSTIRTGRASPALVEGIRVDYHGVPTPLNQLAGIAVPEPRLLVIQPWDRTTTGAIERALLKSDLGLTPNNDGRVIRLVLPQPTEERRRDLVRAVRRKVEEGRVAVRNIRRAAADDLRAQQRDGSLSEDDCKRALEQLQTLTDGLIAEVNAIGKAKEAEVMEI